MRPRRIARAGFTLLEVVVALLVLEVAVVGLVGSLVLAASLLTRAEGLETAVATAEGVLDSLTRAQAAGSDSVAYTGGGLWWSIDDSGRVTLRAMQATGDTVLELSSSVAAR